MAEMISSAVAHEAVSQVLSSLQERYVGESDGKEHLERMEMAHIKLQAAIETSEKWDITSAPLLRWRRKLKRAAQECDDTLRSCKQRVEAENEETMDHGAWGSSFPKRLAHTARSLVSSIFSRGNHRPSRSTVRRFEWFADGAGEFLRYVELGGTPRRYMFLDTIVRHLLAGEATKYCFTHGSQQLLLFLRPFILPEQGTEGGLMFLLEDSDAPENDFLVAVHLRLSESTDIVGVIVRCMQLFTPQFGSTADTVKTRLTQLPTQDFFWVPCSSTIRKEHWEDLYTIFCQWSRPNPLCCQQHGRHRYAGSGSTSSSPESMPCDVYMEPVTEVYLQGHISLSATRPKKPDGKGLPYLKLGGLFSPHAPSKDLSPAVGGSATEIIDGDEATRRSLYANIRFEQLGEIMLTKATDHFCESEAATSYQMVWKSKHGGAYIRLEKAWARATVWKGTGRSGGKVKSQGKKVQGGTGRMCEFVSSWGAHAPSQLQGSIANWVQKDKKMSPYEEVMMAPTPTEQTSSLVLGRG